MELNEIVADKEKQKQTDKAPEKKPGGATVVVLNDSKTPAEVVVEAIAAGARMSVEEAYNKMMAAHKGGWVPVKTYPTVDIADTVAHHIQEHAAANTRYDHYKPLVKHSGPWALTCEVQEI